VRALASAVSVSDARTPVVRAGIFKIRIESDHSAYKLGDPIQIRVLVTDETAVPYAALVAPPWGICKLIIVDAQNMPVVSPGSFTWRMSLAAMYEFAPGATVIASYDDRGQTRQWADIAWWGYHLTKPGQYTITAVPEIIGLKRSGNGPTAFLASETDRSNTLLIRIGK
jgi:hypothetical protein